MRRDKYRPFRREPIFSIKEARIPENNERKHPRIIIKDDCIFTAIKLAKEGYFNGNPQDILNAPVNVVQSILEYENFVYDYEQEYIALNKEK